MENPLRLSRFINTRSFDTEESVPDLKQRKIYAKGIWQPFKPPVIGIGYGRNEQGPRPQVMPRGPTFTFSTGSENKPSEPSVSIFGKHAVSSTSQIQRDTAAAPGDTDSEKVERAPLITENKIVVSETPASFFFSIEGKFSIPSDGVAHQVSVAKLTPSAKVIYATTPRIDPRVFVQCEVTNDSEYPILPGPVMVVFDNRFISKTSIQVSHNSFVSLLHVFILDNFMLFQDNRIRWRFICGNLAHNEVHDRNITDDQRLKVFLRKPDGLAEAKDGEIVDLKRDELRVGWKPVVDGRGGYKEGKFEWKCKVGSGRKVAVEAEWDVKAAQNIEWEEARD